MSANETRGEVSVVLDGTEYVLRPSQTAIEAFEAATDKGLVALFNEASNGTMHVATAAMVITHCIRAHGEKVNDTSLKGVNAKRIGELILEADGGIIFVLIRLRQLLLNAASGGYTAQGEVKATAATETPAAA